MKKSTNQYQFDFIDKMKKDADKEITQLGCGIVIACVLAIALALFVTPIFLMLTWNLAVCALFPALPIMSYWVAFGVNLFLGIIGSKFKTSITQNFKDYFN